MWGMHAMRNKWHAFPCIQLVDLEKMWLFILYSAVLVWCQEKLTPVEMCSNYPLLEGG